MPGAPGAGPRGARRRPAAANGDLAEPDPPAEERVAQAFLVRHPQGTSAVYRRALRHWARWCAAREVPLLEAHREHVELWLCEQEEPAPGAAGGEGSKGGRRARG